MIMISEFWEEGKKVFISPALRLMVIIWKWFLFRYFSINRLYCLIFPNSKHLKYRISILWSLYKIKLVSLRNIARKLNFLLEGDSESQQSPKPKFCFENLSKKGHKSKHWGKYVCIAIFQFRIFGWHFKIKICNIDYRLSYIFFIYNNERMW